MSMTTHDLAAPTIPAPRHTPDEAIGLLTHQLAAARQRLWEAEQTHQQELAAARKEAESIGWNLGRRTGFLEDFRYGLLVGAVNAAGLIGAGYAVCRMVRTWLT